MKDNILRPSEEEEELLNILGVYSFSTEKRTIFALYLENVRLRERLKVHIELGLVDGTSNLPAADQPIPYQLTEKGLAAVRGGEFPDSKPELVPQISATPERSSPSIDNDLSLLQPLTPVAPEGISLVAPSEEATGEEYPF